MPKRRTKSSSRGKSGQKPGNRKRSKPVRRRKGLGSLVLFWPFDLFHALIRPLPGVIRLPLRLVGDLGILALYLLVPLALFYHARAREFDLAKVAEMPERSVVLDRRGAELGRIHGEKRDIIRYADISQYFLQAILAREDERFFSHGGVDWIGFGRATLRNVKDRDMTQGASTITMQLARNTYPLHAPWLSFNHTLQELDRKLLELAVSYRIEANYAKEEILQHYVNRIFWGHSIRGIEEASRTYFEKHAKDLSLSESALLAGIVRGPNAFSPFRDFDGAREERDSTLQRMIDSGAITEAEAAQARAEEITIRPEWRRVFHDSWAMDAVRRELERILEEESIEFGGLQITTTIDKLLQDKAEEALDKHLRSFERAAGYPHQTRSQWNSLPEEERGRPEYLQGSVVVIENLTGAIVATVGGRDADESKFNRATQAKRQIGSTFKPFVYLAAFDKGLRPDTYISDDPIRRGEVRGAGGWSPQNSDGSFTGLQPAEYGLIRSRNTMSVRVGEIAGIDHVQDVAHSVGFENELNRDPTAYLGTLDASPTELASAYTVFPNRGVRYRPYLIAEIRDRDGNKLYPPGDTPAMAYEATRSGSSWTVSRILRKVMERGTGASVRRLGFHKPCAGKTGTTNDYRDAWFAGYTSSLTGVVWVGLDTPKRTIYRGYGSVLSLPVWAEVMKIADRLGYVAEGLDSQLSFIDCRLCRSSGKRATAGCEDAGEAYNDSVPVDLVPAESDLCPVHPARARAVEEHGSPPKAKPIGEAGAAPPAAVPVDEASPPRAVPVD